MMSLSCDCGAYLFKIRFSPEGLPEGLIVYCTHCGTTVGTLVESGKAEAK